VCSSGPANSSHTIPSRKRDETHTCREHLVDSREYFSTSSSRKGGGGGRPRNNVQIHPFLNGRRTNTRSKGGQIHTHSFIINSPLLVYDLLRVAFQTNIFGVPLSCHGLALRCMYISGPARSPHWHFENEIGRLVKLLQPERITETRTNENVG